MLLNQLHRIVTNRGGDWHGRLAGVNPWQARALLATIFLLAAYGLMVSWGESAPGGGGGGEGEDIRLYKAVVDRLHDGESYYAVVGEELRNRGYALRPAFNWRLPTLASFLAVFPSVAWAKTVLTLLIVFTFIVWIFALRKEEYNYALVGGGVLILLSLSGFLGKDVEYFHETWAAVLVALCLAARRIGLLPLSLLAAMLALSIRELALVPVGVLLLLSLTERKWGEASGWLLIIGVFAAGLLLHLSTVSSLIQADDPANSWVRVGGWDFVLRTGVWSGVFALLPPWAIALAMPACLTGLLHWNGRLGDSIAGTTFAYVLSFLFVGRPDNFYWGVMYAPILTLGLLFVPSSFGCLWRRARVRPVDAGQDLV